jgi:hypothetical protein
MSSRRDLADRLFSYELGELNEEQTLQFFADLVASGWAHDLQGHYGRTARDLITAGWITEDGEVNAYFIDEEDE